jgi:hypothetical protein
MSIKYNKRPQNGPSVHKKYRHLPLQGPPKFTQIWIFGLKTNHLATLLECPHTQKTIFLSRQKIERKREP